MPNDTRVNLLKANLNLFISKYKNKLSNTGFVDFVFISIYREFNIYDRLNVDYPDICDDFCQLSDYLKEQNSNYTVTTIKYPGRHGDEILVRFSVMKKPTENCLIL